MVSGDVKAASLQRLQHFRRLDIYQCYQRTRDKIGANDADATDFSAKNIHTPTPWRLYQELRRLRPDIIQGPEPFSILMMFYLLPVFLYIVRHPETRLVVVSLEPIPLARKYHPLLNPFFRLILRPYFRRACVIFWFVIGSRENFVNFGAPEDKLVNQMYGNWGVDLDFWTPEGDTIQHFTDKPTLLFVGRLAPEKGVTYLIEAFRQLRERGLKAGLAIVGDGPEREQIEAQAKASGYGDDIIFYGFIKNKELPVYFRGADIVVHPTVRTRILWEQWGYVGIQSLACGKPIVISNTPQMREVVADETGLFAEEKNPKAIADAVAYLLEHPEERADMAMAARSYAERRFHEAKNVAVTEQTILERCSTVRSARS